MNSLSRRVRHGQDGQVLVMVAVSLIALLGIAALAVDIGYLYHAQNELQASTNAAATAGALDLSNNLSASQAVTDAKLWSGISGGKNAYKDLPGVTMVSPAPKGECLTYLTNLGLSCNNAAGDNAFYVKQQVTVPTFFAKLFHINSLTLTATALSAMKGGTPLPANVVVIMDTTSRWVAATPTPTALQLRVLEAPRDWTAPRGESELC